MEDYQDYHRLQWTSITSPISFPRFTLQRLPLYFILLAIYAYFSRLVVSTETSLALQQGYLLSAIALGILIIAILHLIWFNVRRSTSYNPIVCSLNRQFLTLDRRQFPLSTFDSVAICPSLSESIHSQDDKIPPLIIRFKNHTRPVRIDFFSLKTRQQVVRSLSHYLNY
jgi:hypothetical protein